MDQNLTNDDFFESVANVDIPLRNTNNVGERSNKCNRCEYASSVKGNLKIHLKTHTGGKTNKCKRCNYACSQAGTLKRHLKMHSEKSATNATNATLPLLRHAI